MTDVIEVPSNVSVELLFVGLKILFNTGYVTILVTARVYVHKVTIRLVSGKIAIVLFIQLAHYSDMCSNVTHCFAQLAVNA